MKTTIIKTGKKALIEETELKDESLTYAVIVKGKLYPDLYSIRLKATNLEHATRIFDSKENKVEGRWQINGCSKGGYWIADRYYYKFKNKEERELKLELALAHAAYWYTRYSIRNPLPPKTVYTVAEIF